MVELLEMDLPEIDPRRLCVLRPLDRGGISRVFVAHDEELNREVALKQLRRRYADRPRSRSRFLFEAEVTAGLEHPGVVPVYGLGRFADGRIFFTMRLIRGESLREAIRRAHRPDQSKGRGWELRRLLDRLVDVCYTVDYAHGRGIVHRDLTPGNIMLGVHGETLVIDWGLAKPAGRPSSEDEGSSGEAIWPASARDLPLTRDGNACGTTWYMSPEQASARPERLQPATDVYTLGATLYTVLTGRGPFDGSDEDEVQKQVQKGEFQPPRRVDRKIAPALEAICLKAMEFEPENRYASPLDLGNDLANWLARRPVAASQDRVVRPAV
jgi:serine/threonine protein kinase